MTSMMSPTHFRNFAPGPPPNNHQQGYIQRPGPLNPPQPRRYEPYQIPYPRPYRPPPLNVPRHVPPPPPTPSSTSPLGYPTGPKQYDPLRPEGLYQASKGARRDVKWMQKQIPQSARRLTPPQPSPSYEPRQGQRVDPLELPRAFDTYPRQGEISPPRSRRDDVIHLSPPVPHPHPGPIPRRLPQETSGIGAGFEAKRDDTKEQQAVIVAARAEWVREVREKQEKKKVEWERKIKRIQLQVFVHARPTPCPWDSCPAQLNSWALLEKHLHHAHLHPGSKGLPPPGEPIKCKIQSCDQVFGTGPECYQHCLSTHMRQYGARCPFNCAYEGPSFLELLAHVGRRHRGATPDDFVPGLIHHIPNNLPPASALPQFPKRPSPPPLKDPPRPWEVLINGKPLLEQVKPFQGERSSKIVREIRRKCLSHKNPLREGYVKKRGAIAAIGAILDNVQRNRLTERAVPTSHLRHSLTNDQEAEEGDFHPIRGSAEDGLFHSVQITKPLLDCIDVDAEKRRAEKEAKAEIKQLVAEGKAMGNKPRAHRFWTRSHSAESDNEKGTRSSTGTSASTNDEKPDAWYVRHQQRLLHDKSGSPMELSDDSDSSDTSDSGSSSTASSYVPRRQRDASGSERSSQPRTRKGRFRKAKAKARKSLKEN